MNAITPPYPIEALITVPETTAAVQRQPLDPKQLAMAKCAFTTRRVDFQQAKQLLSAGIAPQTGDLVLARIRRLRQHGRIELASGRRATLYPGDLVVLTYGNRYATDQFEARVPEHLGPCHMVAAGGIASQVLSRNASIKPATEIEPLGILGDAKGQPLNLRRFALPPTRPGFARAPTLAVIGSSMNAGKTTAAADLIFGLARSGLRVGAAKITGTGSGGDLWLMNDAGASQMIDFTDAGLASTDQCDLGQLTQVLHCLTGHLQRLQPDVIVLEVADGIYQRETAQLLQSAAFRAAVDGILYASGDMVGAVSGARWLLDQRLPVVGIAGKVTQSELAVREVVAVSELPVYARHQLQDEGIARQLHQFLQAQQHCADAKVAG